MVAEHNGSPLHDLVRVQQGTASHFAFSNGNTLPLIGMPFGMCYWVPETAAGNWFYHPEHRKLRGLRATRQPSPWIGDYGHFQFLPQCGEAHVAADARASAFRPQEMQLSPSGIEVYLRRDRIRLQLSATERCALARVQFEGTGAKRLIFETPSGAWTVDESQQVIRAQIYANSGGVPDNFCNYVFIHLDAAFRLGSDTSDNLLVLELNQDLEQVHLRIGQSFISDEQAQINLAREIPDTDLDTLRQQIAATWQQQLSLVEIEGATDEQRQTFYTALYRCFLFPRMLHEINAAGQQQHYSPFDGQVHDGPLYTDNGFWDTHRTCYPLYALLCPERLSEMLEGWINAYRAGGWMPKWASPGYRACMIGTHIDAVFADAYAKGISFDVEAAYAGLKKHAFTESDGSNRHGRFGLASFIELGYVPCDQVKEATSRTMDFAYNDWCIAQIADGVGDHETRDRLIERSAQYRNVFDPNCGFMRGRNADGSWRENSYAADGFSATEWGGPFVEGSAWQCGWAVQHDPAGFIELHGGAEQVEQKLDTLLATEPRFEVGSYGQEIHEMSEMAAVDFGQYAHSNQPSHHILYYYTLVGRLDKCGYWVRKTCEELYSPDADGLAGDEDNGEMSAWYVFSALGFYPFCPGSDQYVLGAPLFDKAIVRLSSGEKLVVTSNSTDIAIDANPEWSNEHGATINQFIKHADMLSGMTLTFRCG